RKQSAKCSIGGAIDETIPQSEAPVFVVRLDAFAAARRAQVQAVSANVAGPAVCAPDPEPRRSGRLLRTHGRPSATAFRKASPPEFLADLGDQQGCGAGYDEPR